MAVIPEYTADFWGDIWSYTYYAAGEPKSASLLADTTIGFTSIVIKKLFIIAAISSATVVIVEHKTPVFIILQKICAPILIRRVETKKKFARLPTGTPQAFY